jgi:hypothetical protein
LSTRRGERWKGKRAREKKSEQDTSGAEPATTNDDDSVHNSSTTASKRQGKKTGFLKTHKKGLREHAKTKFPLAAAKGVSEDIIQVCTHKRPE